MSLMEEFKKKLSSVHSKEEEIEDWVEEVQEEVKEEKNVPSEVEPKKFVGKVFPAQRKRALYGK